MSDIIEKKLERLIYWRDGNGAKGAEVRLQECEVRIERIEDGYVAKEGCLLRQETLRREITSAVREAMSGGKSVRQWLQILAPYAAVGVSLYLALR